MHTTTRESPLSVATAPQSPDCQGGAPIVETFDSYAELARTMHRRAGLRAELDPATWTTPADGFNDGGRPYTWLELAAADEHVAETLARRRRARRALTGDDAA